MGGYDIFKSVFNSETNTWSTPINLEFPINSPDDDYLFVTDSLEKTAYFSTGRQSPPGKIDVLTINVDRQVPNVLSVKGKVEPELSDQSLNSSISVKYQNSVKEVGVFQANDDGDYLLEVPNGAELLFTVETKGLPTQSEKVSIPNSSISKPFRQVISYEAGKLKILNYFDEEANDSNYLQYLKVIEKKAKLDVNTEQVASVNQDGLASNNQKDSKNKNSVGPQLIEESSAPAANANKLPNKQLAQEVKKEAQANQKDARKLQQDVADANKLAQEQQASGTKKIEEAQVAISTAETISDETEKSTAIEKATNLKAEGEREVAIAANLISYAKALEEDANTKRNVSSANTQFSEALNKSKSTSIGNDKALVELQSQVISKSTYTSSSDAYIKLLDERILEQEKQVESLEKNTNDNSRETEEIKTEITNLEEQLGKTKKKSAKQTISDQIVDLKSSVTEKETLLKDNNEQLKSKITELESLKKEKELITKIKTEDLSPTQFVSTAPVKINAQSLKEKYSDKIVVTDISDLNSVETANQQLKNYNAELDALIATDKKELTATKNAKTKQQLNAEIKQLTATKKSNQQTLVKNEKQIENLNKSLLADKANAPVALNLNPLTANTGTLALSQLDNLNKQLDYNDSKNFEYNSYTNQDAQKLKIEADAEINTANAQQKILKEQVIASAKEIQIQNEPGIEELETEAEDLFTKAQGKRGEANSKAGNEKVKLQNEAKGFETQANEKLIQASEIIKKDNQIIYQTNQENIEKLILDKKSPSEDISKARNLIESANISLKQGAAIREEANSLNSLGAKLGNISNAEEKEAEAIQKQNEALDLLKKSNPDLVLAQAATSTSKQIGATDSLNTASKIAEVNKQLNDVITSKINSYSKLYEANALEITQQYNKVSTSQSVIDATPSLKTEFMASSKKLEQIKEFKQKSDEANDPSQKLSQLINATKKQTEAINQLTGLENSISIVSSINPVESIPVANPAETSAPASATISPVPVNLSLVNIADLNAQDTSATQILNFITNQNTSIRNEQAFRSSKNSLNELKRLENESKNLKDDAASNEELRTILGQNSSSSDLKKIAVSVENDAEQLATQAAEKFKEAGSKRGEEKENLLSEAKSLDNQALNKRYLASTLNQKAFDIDFKTNDIAIRELREKLSGDNLTLNSEQDQLNVEVQNITKQIQKLKEEASNLPNRSAKLGALSNVEEKEVELIQKQTNLLEGLKKQYPDYVVQPLAPDSISSLVEAPINTTSRENELNGYKFTELTNLTNAFTLEYETSKNLLPDTLTLEQLAVKQNADALNEESKRLLLESSQESDSEQKLKKMSLAAKFGNTSLEQLNKLLPAAKTFNMKSDDLTALNAIGNEIQSSNEGNEVGGSQTLSIEGLEIIKGNAYTAEKPIPFDSEIEDGLVFRVQIGAFKTQLPNTTFKGLSPLNGETTKNGYYRYTAGNFNKIEAANAVKNDLRKLGYRDAFVVAYRNGKRISASEAISLLAEEGKSVDIAAPQTAGITENLNIPKSILSEQAAPVNPQDLVQVTKEIDQINGLLYTIQIGVYSKQATKQGLLNLQPIYTKQLPNGLYRYTAGIYNDSLKVVVDRNRVAELGINDAFISAYLNGSSIAFTEAKRRQLEDGSIKMEEENPIVFPTTQVVQAIIPTNTENNTPAITTVQPFTNNVNSYPAPTEDNGIKVSEEGISFKVQIGAFSKQVPNDVAAKFSEIKNWPVENKQVNGLFIYNIGNFSSASFAKTLKEEVVRLGIVDAFITVYRNGSKLYGQEASTLLAQ